MGGVVYLQIEPTTRCNYTCIFCCGRHMEQGDMSFDLYQKIIDSFPDLQCVNLQGEGEPFIHPEIFEMISYAKSKKLMVQTITNGSLIKSQVKKILDSNIDILHISIETPDELEYKRIRGGSLEQVIEGIKLLIAEREKFGLNRPVIGFKVTILKHNRLLLKKIFDLYRNLEMNGGIDIQPLSRRPFYLQYYSGELAKEFLSKAEALILADDFRELNKNIVIDDLIKQVSDYPKELNTCPWLEQGMFFNIFGYATGCCTIKDYQKFAFGKMGKDSVSEILLARDKSVEMMENNIIPEMCKDCLGRQ